MRDAAVIGLVFEALLPADLLPVRRDSADAVMPELASRRDSPAPAALRVICRITDQTRSLLRFDACVHGMHDKPANRRQDKPLTLA
jgi:hypothetical protein